MFRVRRPTAAEIRRFQAVQSGLDLTYAAVGATAAVAPAGFVVDHIRVRLGEGEAMFERAKRCLREWRQFDLGWLYAAPTETPLRAGEVVVVAARVCGIWSLNAARIVYATDQPQQFGFAYGTLPGHVERGEERFLIERAEDGSVWYDLRAFSQPRHLLTKLGYPLVRRLQKRFGRESAEAVRRAVRETTERH